eukprot:2286114-Pyramimonas_sp.AAC.1
MSRLAPGVLDTSMIADAFHMPASMESDLDFHSGGPEASDPVPELDGDAQPDRHMTCVFQATVKGPK